MPDMDWVFEHDTLPPEDSLQPPPAPQKPGRRVPIWLWPAAGFLAVALGAAAYLWQMGGRSGPLPNPAPSTDRLAAAVQLEINAYQTGDGEIVRQLQDNLTGRADIEPPLDAWKAAEETNEMRVEEVQSLGEARARAEILFTWEGKPYRTFWYYRQRGDRWLHTDWVDLDLEPAERLTSPHLQVTYHRADRDQATAIIGRLETLVADLCRFLSCPAERFPVGLEISTEIVSYQAEPIPSDDHLAYRVASPQRVRWPESGQPEPVILASVARHLVYDVWLAPQSASLSAQNQAAATLGAFWMVHHLLRAEIPPSIRWLEQAAQQDGLDAASAFVRAMIDNVAPDTALDAALLPETVDWIIADPDFFGWRALLLTPRAGLSPPPLANRQPPYAQRVFILHSFDWNAQPWAPDGQIYRQVAPYVVQVRLFNQWAHALSAPQSQWAPVYSFRLEGDEWLPAEPDETALGGLQTSSAGRFIITHHAVDQPYLADLGNTLESVYQVIAHNFQVEPESPLRVVVGPPGQTASTGEVHLTSPTFGGAGASLGSESEVAAGLIWPMLSRTYRFDEMPEDTVFLWLGVLLWQLSEYGYDVDAFLADVLEIGSAPRWQPPATTGDPGWHTLADLWQSPAQLGQPGQGDRSYLFRYPVLLTRYIVTECGADKLPVMLDSLHTSGTFDAWITAATGQESDQFETTWREWVIANG